MQSHLYSLRWGKLVLVRPCRLSSASSKTFNSTLRKPPYRSTWFIQQKRQGSTSAGHKLESLVRQHGRKHDLEEEAQEGVQPGIHHDPEESFVAGPSVVPAPIWQQSMLRYIKGSSIHHTVRLSKPARLRSVEQEKVGPWKSMPHFSAGQSTEEMTPVKQYSRQQNLENEEREEGIQAEEDMQENLPPIRGKMQQGVDHELKKSSLPEPTKVPWKPRGQRSMFHGLKDSSTQQPVELSESTRQQSITRTAEESYAQETMVSWPPAEQQDVDHIPEEHDVDEAMAPTEFMKPQMIEQNPQESDAKETLVSWTPFTRFQIPKPTSQKSLFASQRTRQKIPSPLRILGEYLDIQDASQRIDKIAKLIGHLDPCRLPSIFLYYLHRKHGQGLAWTVVDNNNQFLKVAQDYLGRKGFTEDDMAHWHWILSGDSTTTMVDRFFHTSSPKPHFLLSQILRRDGLHVASFHTILNHLKNMDMIAGTQKMETDGIESSQSTPGARIESNAFEVLISRLLYQARRVWPAAMVDIIRMAEPHFSSVMNKEMSEAETRLKISRLSNFLNYLIGLLSLPAKTNPLASVRHNWKAQKVMLELAGKFDPPLRLSLASYRSIVRVLAANSKTYMESKSATLRTRSWPPWRRDEDGMDASRLLEEDYSRVIQALFKAQEAGYRQDDQDISIGIYGGLEPDGTPTIQTRRSLRRPRDSESNGSMSSQVWAARVEATRDVQEAWSAFLQFREEGGSPKQDMFLAMFAKLNYDSALPRKRKYTAPPGDGKEVLAVSNDNYTSYYIERHRPPRLPALYREMLEMGVRPSGRCLMFLIRKARTTDEGLKYLLDSGLDNKAIRVLAEGASSPVSATELSKIPDAILHAYIDLTCRLASRAVKEYSDWRSLPEDDSEFAPRFTFLADSSGGAEGSETWTIVDQRPTHVRHHRARESYKHVSFLIKASSTTFRPVWYAYFRALARGGAVIAREVVGNPKQDSLAWQRICATLKDFESHGLELEPEGFHHICVGFEKFAGGGLGKFTAKYRATARKDCKILRNAFAKLSTTQHASKDLPVMFHTIRGIHLHAYVRALGAAEDHEGIISAFEWMVKNNEELEAISYENRNGLLGFQRTIIAIRYLLEGSSYGEQARQLASKVTWWGEWPSDEAVVSYMRGSDHSEAEEDIVVKDLSRADWD